MATSTTAAAPSLSAVFIVSALRSPIGSFQGSLKKLTAPQIATQVVTSAIKQAGLAPTDIEEVYMGNVIQASLGQNPTRQVVIQSGCPPATEATTINKVCASGMKSIMLAAQNIQTGQRSVMVAGGMESMSNTPYYFPRNQSFGHPNVQDSIIKDGLWDVYNQIHMGNCAEYTAKRHSITREEQDEFAIESYRKASEAWKRGLFKHECIPIEIPSSKPGQNSSEWVNEDEEYKNIKLDKVKQLKPVFQKQDGTVTAANASNLNDGASAVVLMTGEEADQRGVKKLARIVSFADAACAPIDFPIAPAKAIPIALEKASLSLSDISKFELNEAFSVVGIANIKILGIDKEKVNVHGGAVALGHPIGSSGCRIVVTLVHALKSGEYGVAGICNGGGGASAMVIEKL